MKVYFCGMSGPGSLEDLKELLGPIHQFFSGIIWTLHDSVGSEEEKYLESIKGEGKVIHYYYTGRHSESRNQYLWCGPLKNGDWIMSCDTLERPAIEICKNIREYIDYFINQFNSNAIYYYGKPYIFEYHESLVYQGSPHEGLRRLDGKMKSFDLKAAQPDESKIRLNVRPIKRPDKFGYISHYLKYYLQPWGSNHCVLGAEHTGVNKPSFQVREQNRLNFKDELTKRGYDQTVTGVKQMFLDSNGLDSMLLKFVNCDKITNDFYRYEILGDLTVNDNHHWDDLIKF